MTSNESRRKYQEHLRQKRREYGPEILRTKKRCPECRLTKATVEFQRDRSNNDGFTAYCKECKIKKDKALRQMRKQTGPRIDRIEKLISEHIGERKDGYHLDHKLPLCAFDYSDQHQIAASWHPANLQWLKAADNLKKSGKFCKSDFENYMRWYDNVCTK